MRKNIAALKSALVIAMFTMATVAVFSFGTGKVKVAFAQGFPFSVCFPGVQPNCTTDFGTPPISFSVQGGLTSANGLAIQTVPIGSVAYGSFGNATTTVAGTIYTSAIYISSDRTITNINILNGGTIGTDKGIVAIYNTGGTLLGTSALAGTPTAGANAFQTYTLTTQIAVQGPGRYYISYQSNGATDNIRTVAASTFINVGAQSATGAFATLPNLTPFTSFTANVGPIAYIN